MQTFEAFDAALKRFRSTVTLRTQKQPTPSGGGAAQSSSNTSGGGDDRAAMQKLASFMFELEKQLCVQPAFSMAQSF
jgi:hypothetical protein